MRLFLPTTLLSPTLALSSTLLSLASSTLALAALDVELPAPTRISIHPDGAVLTHRVELPAGDHRVLLPVDASAEITARDTAAWRAETIPGARAPLPNALTALLPERNQLATRQRALQARAEALAANDERFRARLPRVAQDVADTAPWQKSLDALLSAQDALAQDVAKLTAEVEALIERAAAIVHDDALAERLLRPARIGGETVLELTAADLAAMWDTHAPLIPGRRAMALHLTTAGTITIEARRTDVQWLPAATLNVRTGTDHARLARQARISKPQALELGTPAVELTTVRLRSALAAPSLNAVALNGEAVQSNARKQVQTGATSTDWSAVKPAVASPVAPVSVAGGAPAAAAASEAITGDTATMSAANDQETTRESTIDVALEAPEKPMITSDGLPPQRFVIKQVALPAGTAALVADCGVAEVHLDQDEWLLAPALSPVLIHRVSMRLDQQPLLAGPLNVNVDGVPSGSDTLSYHAPGALVHLRVGEDDRVYVGSTSIWQVDPASQTDRRQRQGSDRWLFNLGDQPRTVRVYLAMPISRSAELTITPDIATTAGYDTAAPGLLRWTITVAPGAPTRVGLGWVLEASGGLKL